MRIGHTLAYLLRCPRWDFGWAPHNGASLFLIYLHEIDVLCKIVNDRKVWKVVEITFEVGISFVRPILTAVEPWLLRCFRGELCVGRAKLSGLIPPWN